ncbi:unnamed protein product [Closterium sp. Naga37s-1]|nr:unnamed protein product [Closterium sp. Naga37s-1]
MEGDIREQVQVAHEEVTAALGPGVVADGAQAGSRTHRVRRYWTNGVSEAALQYRLSLMERPAPLLDVPFTTAMGEEAGQGDSCATANKKVTCKGGAGADNVRRDPGTRRAATRAGHPLERRWVYPWEEEDERPMVYAEQEEIWLPGDREEEAVDKKREDFSWLEEAIERQRSRERYEREFGFSDFVLMAATKEEGPKGVEAQGEQTTGGTEVAQQSARGTEGAEQPKEELQASRRDKGVQEWVIGEGVSAADAGKLKEVLAKHRAAFAYSLKEVRRCNMVEVTLELTTDIPVYQRRGV